MINKKTFRKIILEEILRNIRKKQLINEGIPFILAGIAGGAAVLGAATAVVGAYTDDPLGAKVDKVTTHTPANNIYLKLKNLIASIDNAIIIDETKSKELARKLEKATLDYTVLGVPGTDEDAIRDTIKESGSQINFAKVCVAFHDLTTKSFKDVYRDELGGGFEIGSTGYMKDQKTYVIEPIQDLPFIVIDVDGTEKGLSEKEFFEQLKLAKSGQTNKNTSSGTCTPPKEFEAPYFANSVEVMNKYAKDKNIKGWVDGPVQEKWVNAHQKCWEMFVDHAFNNCALYKGKYNLPNKGKTWKEVSDTLIGDFPGYTYNKQGFLAFCLDAFCCENTYGAQSRSSGSSGRGSGGGGGTPPAVATNRGQTRTTSEGAKIILNKTNKNFKGSGFSSPNGDIDNLIISAIKTHIKQSGQNTGIPAFSISFSAELDNTGKQVKDVKSLKGEGSGSFIKRRGVLTNKIDDIMKNINFPSGGAYSGRDGSGYDTSRIVGQRRSSRRGGKFIYFTVKFPAGRIR